MKFIRVEVTGWYQISVEDTTTLEDVKLLVEDMSVDWHKELMGLNTEELDISFRWIEQP